MTTRTKISGSSAHLHYSKLTCSHVQIQITQDIWVLSHLLACSQPSTCIVFSSFFIDDSGYKVWSNKENMYTHDFQKLKLTTLLKSNTVKAKLESQKLSYSWEKTPWHICKLVSKHKSIPFMQIECSEWGEKQINSTAGKLFWRNQKWFWKHQRTSGVFVVYFLPYDKQQSKTAVVWLHQPGTSGNVLFLFFGCHNRPETRVLQVFRHLARGSHEV